jgi:hypothetical protein
MIQMIFLGHNKLNLMCLPMSDRPFPDTPEPRPRDTHCPACGSDAIVFDENEGFYQCQVPICSYLWGYPEDDPDYEEVEFSSEVMELLYQTDPAYWAKLVEGY